MRTKGLWLVVALYLLIFSMSKPIHAAQESTLESLYKAAKAEGELMVWSPTEPEDMQILTAEFNKDFPGIKVHFFEIRETDYVPRVVAESMRGIVGLDVGTSKYVVIHPLLERNLIQSYNDWTKVFKDLNPASVSKDGRFLDNDDYAFIVAYNTQLVKPNEVPTSWDELLAPKWRGKILVEPRANAFAYLGLKWGRDKTVEYVKKLSAQKPTFVKGGTALTQQLAAGAGYLGIGGYAYKVESMKREGAPIDWAKKITPIGVMAQALFVTKGGQHPNAGKLFAGWWASPKGQNIMINKMLRGALNPGSSYFIMQEFEKNRVELVKETLDNSKEAAALNAIAAKSLGTFK
jgi:iron(III) transport system substrate-binding protein